LSGPLFLGRDTNRGARLFPTARKSKRRVWKEIGGLVGPEEVMDQVKRLIVDQWEKGLGRGQDRGGAGPKSKRKEAGRPSAAREKNQSPTNSINGGGGGKGFPGRQHTRVYI